MKHTTWSKVTMTNTAPANAVDLPSYLTGNIIPEGEVVTNVLLYAPAGGQVEDVRISRGEQGVFSQTTTASRSSAGPPGSRSSSTTTSSPEATSPERQYCK